MPYGEQRLLEIALAFACKPRVLLLDEPAAGVPEAERATSILEHDRGTAGRRDRAADRARHGHRVPFADRISVLVNGDAVSWRARRRRSRATRA